MPRPLFRALSRAIKVRAAADAQRAEEEAAAAAAKAEAQRRARARIALAERGLRRRAEARAVEEIAQELKREEV